MWMNIQETHMILSRWWFQIFFMFIPVWGRFPIWLIFFKGVETTTKSYVYIYIRIMGSGNQIGNLLRFWFYRPLIAPLVAEALVVPRYRSEGVWDMCWFLGGEVWLVDVGRNWRQPSLMLGLRVMWDDRYRMIHYMDLYCILYKLYTRVHE